MSAQVCRICLRIIKDDSQLFNFDADEVNENSKCIKTKLKSCIPEIDFDRVKDSVICKSCVMDLDNAYNFKTKCLQSEAKISQFFTEEPIELIEYITENDAYCNDEELDPCIVCSEKFNSNEELRKHMLSHVSKCSMCEYEVNVKSMLEEHLKTHSDSDSLNLKVYNCSVCDYSTTEKSTFLEHRVFHTGEQLFSCNLCTFRSMHASSVRRHLKVHTGERPYRCSECHYGASDEASLNEHMKTHAQNSVKRRYHCEECLYSTTKKPNLKIHVSKTHCINTSTSNGIANDVEATNIEPYRISIDEIKNILKKVNTGVSFKTIENDSLKNVNPLTVTITDIKKILYPEDKQNGNVTPLHNNKENSESKKNVVFKCRYCRKTFKVKHLLKQHISNIHEKLQQCKECGYSTTVKSHFKVHVNTHTGGTVYECDKCQYKSVYSSKFEKHKRVHLSTKSHNCPYCNFKTNEQVCFDIHMNTHLNQNPYTCSECPYNAFTEAALQTHMELHAFGNNYADDDVVFVAPTVT